MAGWVVGYRLGGLGVCLCCVGFFEGDAVAECFELADGVGFGVFGAALGVVVGSGVAVELAVDEHVSGGCDHGVFDGDDGLHRSAACGDAAESRVEERGVGGSGCD